MFINLIYQKNYIIIFLCKLKIKMQLFSLLKTEKQPEQKNKQTIKEISKAVVQQLQLKKMKPQYTSLAYTILIDLFKYPSTEEAQIHKSANQLGSKDVKVKYPRDKQLLNLTTNDNSFQTKENYCQCCGFQVQKQSIRMCQSFENFPKVGISTYLFFLTIKNIILMLVILTAIFSGYSLFTNYKQSNSSFSLQNYPRILSFSSKQLNYTASNSNEISFQLNIQTFLVLTVIIVWAVSIYLFKYFQMQSVKMVDQETITAADFSIMIQNIPIQITQEYLQTQIQKYYYQIEKYIRKNYPSKGNKKFIIQKLNKGLPFYLNPKDFEDQNLESLKNQKEQIIYVFREWIKKLSKNGDLFTTQQKRNEKINRFQEIQAMIEQKNQITVQKIKKEMKRQKTELTTTAFVTFANSKTSNIIAQLHPNDFASKIRFYLTCCRTNNFFKLYWKNKQVSIKISKAPQPEDIIWDNLGVSFCQILMRRLLTYTITFILLAMSFFAVYGLSKLQTQYTNSLISLIISVTITLINSIIGIVIRKLTIFQRDLTQSNHQTSLAAKSIFAQLINSILIPFIVNVYVQQNIYDKNGLVQDVFYLSITNAFMRPIFKILDFYYFYTRILYSSMKQPNNKLGTSQSALNQYAELMSFQIGFQYIYVINLFLFTCFFVTLQPIISVFSIFGLILMYWAQKYVLLNRSNRPIPGSDMINAVIGQFILIGPIFLALGISTWTGFLSNNSTSLRFLIHMISIGVSVFFFILPFNSVYQLIFARMDDQNLNYKENRIILPSQYDRLNPATYEQGILDFMKYLHQMNQNKGKNTNKTVLKNLALFFQNPSKKLNISGPNKKINTDNLLSSVFQINKNAVEKADISKLFSNLNLSIKKNQNKQHNQNQSLQNILSQDKQIEQMQQKETNFATKVYIKPRRSKIYEKKQLRSTSNALNSKLNPKRDSISNQSLFSNQDDSIDFKKVMGTDYNSRKKKVYNPYQNISF